MSTGFDEHEAKEARDLSIECMALLDRSILRFREAWGEEFLVPYRRACGDLIGALGDVINTAAHFFPHLMPTSEVWSEVVAARLGPNVAAPESSSIPGDCDALLALVDARVGQLLGLGPYWVRAAPALTSGIQGVRRLIDQRITRG